jgi:hypothetical protein
MKRRYASAFPDEVSNEMSVMIGWKADGTVACENPKFPSPRTTGAPVASALTGSKVEVKTIDDMGEQILSVEE